MKILCVADHIDPLVYSDHIKTRFKDVELVLGAGDLPLEYYSYIVSCLNIPLMFIYGNHNLSRLNQFRHKAEAFEPRFVEDHYNRTNNAIGATFLEDRSLRFKKKLLIAGLGGSMNYNKGEHQYTEFQMYMRIFHMVPRLLWNRIFHGRWVDILLTHAPPRGIHDKQDQCHLGFKAFVSFMNWFKPKYLVHGHIHLYNLNDIRRTVYKKTEIVNCYDHLVLEFDHV